MNQLASFSVLQYHCKPKRLIYDPSSWTLRQKILLIWSKYCPCNMHIVREKRCTNHCSTLSPLLETHWRAKNYQDKTYLQISANFNYQVKTCLAEKYSHAKIARVAKTKTGNSVIEALTPGMYQALLMSTALQGRTCCSRAQSWRSLSRWTTVSWRPGGSVHRERANFARLVLGCIEAKFASKCLLESSRRDLHNALLCTVLVGSVWVKKYTKINIEKMKSGKSWNAAAMHMTHEKWTRAWYRQSDLTSVL